MLDEKSNKEVMEMVRESARKQSEGYDPDDPKTKDLADQFEKIISNKTRKVIVIDDDDLIESEESVNNCELPAGF